MGTPNDFGGDRSKAFIFESEFMLYLMANAETYNTAEKKITFMLSFMTKGTATEWKLIKVYNYMKDGWPTDFDTFRKEWEETFLPVDAASDARITQALLSGIWDDAALIKYFIEGLHPKITEKIFEQAEVPMKIN
ncbi:hypothetical protein K435DRAFT_867519 [Dendrothele bispora CBS 962.96]|uniref:Retrotransposon gag domain-containing protein n=1 Tax=Dendrothele bispora (strain CBS 962.96) TaxID=1314807 RepID=A0A4S8LE45_DENBC|nr:hypothetical protein K435DRAFT_867519 [Dendrothele bispora CBS 962.96]